MARKEEQSRLFGLIGRNISYSFSRSYFSEKFNTEKINDATYVNFDIHDITEVRSIFKNNPNISGCNVTIPYKKDIIPILDKIDKKAKKIGAVNTIKITKKGKLKGYNTDEYGFRKSLQPLLENHHKKALILGTGGASNAVAYALEKLNISYKFVSRSNGDLLYTELNEEHFNEYYIIINTTPLGTFPNVKECPSIPYSFITNQHLLYDLVYNPEQTQFLKNGFNQGAKTINGLKMLELQAEKAWKIWN